MTDWQTLADTEPAFEEAVRGRFQAHTLGFLATNRTNGYPRISGIEPSFVFGAVWIGMMWQSRKALDLLRDPRCAMHSASIDNKVADGDARVTGVAVDSPGDRGRLAAWLKETTGWGPDDDTWHLFRLDVEHVVLTRVVGDGMVVRFWTPEGGLEERRPSP